MINMIWLVLLVSIAGSHLGYGLPVRPTPQTYPLDDNSSLEGWTPEAGLYAAIPALALVFVALAFLIGCTWCYRHKDCKPNEGADNQLFTASASHIQTPQRLQPPDSGFSEPVNNNVGGEDNNNGPISLREMQNIANNNAGAYIFNENEERNANRRLYSRSPSRESVVLFDPLPVEIDVDDPLESYSEWFTSDHFPRNNLQYLREVGRGWFGRVVASEIENVDGTSQTVAVKILNQNASLEEKARFLEEVRLYRELSHSQILQFLGKCLEEEPWLVLFELCTVNLRSYLIANRPHMTALNESGVPLQLLSDVSSALDYMHSHGFTYGYLWSGSVLIRGEMEEARAVLGRYEVIDPEHDCFAPEVLRRAAVYTSSSEIWSLGTLIWEVCSWGSIPIAADRPAPPSDKRCPYKVHLYQVIQLCWNPYAEERPTAGQVNALINHLHATHALARTQTNEHAHTNAYASSDFEDRWQRLKPNSIPKVDEHIAIVHAPSTSNAPSTSTGHFTESDHGFESTLSVDMDTAVSRSSSIMSDKDPLESQIKSESLTNLHGSLEDIGNIYLTHNETAALECNQGNVLEEAHEKEIDRSDSSVDPWLKEIIAGSQDDVSYYRDVSDVIKNLDNILNSEKTSSSESSHQASPSRDNLSLDCKKEYPAPSNMVKSPGISNFQNFLDTGFPKDDEAENENEPDRDTIGTLSHSFERHSDTASQQTLENLTPDTPMKDFDLSVEVENQIAVENSVVEKTIEQNYELPKEIVNNKLLTLKELCVVSKPSISEHVKEQFIVKDCGTSCDSIRTDNEGAKSLVDVVDTESTPLDEIEVTDSMQEQISPEGIHVIRDVQTKTDEIPSKSEEITKVDETETTSENIRTDTDDIETETDELKTETDEIRSKSEEQTKIDETQSEDVRTEMDEIETVTDEILTETDEVPTRSEEIVEEDNILPENVVATSNEEIDTLPSVTEEVSNATEAYQLKLDSFDEHETTESENNYSKDETILVSDLIDIVTDSSKDHQENKTESKISIDVIIAQEPIPEIVQKLIHKEKEPTDIKKRQDVSNDKNEKLIESMKENAYIGENQKATDSVNEDQEHTDSKDEKVDSVNLTDSIGNNVESISNVETTATVLPPALVQNTINTENLVDSENVNKEIVDSKDDIAMPRSDNYVAIELNERSDNSTVYMDLINNTNSQILNSTVDYKVCKDNKDLETTPTPCDMSSFRNESTVYMDLPSFEIIKTTDDFLHSERMSNDHVDKICASTPIASDNSVDTLENVENSTKENETLVLSESKAVDLTKQEQRGVPDSMSPFDSPTKSHPTDTFDENSSVVLGSFENCSLELFRVKPTVESVEIPREELLAFSSNFSEINLETPSPLRDGNFLNEVPDIMPDDNVFENLVSITEPKDEPPTDSGSGPAGTEKHVSPTTPPNSPGALLSTLYDEDSDESGYEWIAGLNLVEPPVTCPEIVEAFAAEITAKMAMAENENNMNIEYSGPLTVEGLIEEGGAMPENDEIPESILAGNGESLEDLRETMMLDEECVKALRNELELKLPLAQVASIEPPLEGDGEWPSELPPPPEVIVSYPGALSPIQEETGQQLSAYDNDLQWNPSTRTDSSESYPEPCNNSTDEATELPTGNQEHTYTMPSRDNSQNHTYTVCKEAAASSRDLTMSADSLNASPLETKETALSPIDDRTYNKEDDKESNCERLSQVSPFLVSPTTDTSAPNTTDNTRASTSKTTLPTDAKHSKTETQCLSKATSIDSWCSNDTLYNVEENFDDLALEDCEDERLDKEEVNSESTDTLTHNEEAQDHSHCSTYIIHDSKSENCETFSPDSITANDNHTYTKVKTEVLTTGSATDVNDSKNTTHDLAYGTLMSGMPSFSNCTTEVASRLEDAWKLPELVRRSPIALEESLSPPKQPEEKEHDESSPRIAEHSLKKIDSVEISCLQDNITDTTNKEARDIIVVNDSPNCNYRNMTPSVTSTPLFEYTMTSDTTEAIPMQLPNVPESCISDVAFSNFQQSAEVRPQQLSSNANCVNDTNEDTEVLLEGDSKTQNSILFELTPNYSDFENSALNKPQDLNPRCNTHQGESVGSEEFCHFEISVRDCPQDLSSLIDSSSMLLRSERMSGEILMGSISAIHHQGSNNMTNSAEEQSGLQNAHLHISSIPNLTNSAEEQSGLQNAHHISSIPNLTNSVDNQTVQSENVHIQQPNHSDDIIHQTPSDNTHNQQINQSDSIGNQTTQSHIVRNHISSNSNQTDNLHNQQINESDSIVNLTIQSNDVSNKLIDQSDIINLSNQTSQSDSVPNQQINQSDGIENQTTQSDEVQNQQINQSDGIVSQATQSDEVPNKQIYQSEDNDNPTTQSDNVNSLSDKVSNETTQSDNDYDQISEYENVHFQSESVQDQTSHSDDLNLITPDIEIQIIPPSIIDSQADQANLNSDNVAENYVTVQTSPPVNVHEDSQTNLDNKSIQSSMIIDFTQSPATSPPIVNLIESQIDGRETSLLINFGPDDETEQPHSIIMTEIPMNSTVSPNRTYDSHIESNFNHTFNSHTGLVMPNDNNKQQVNGEKYNDESLTFIEAGLVEIDDTEKLPSKSTDAILKDTVANKTAEDFQSHEKSETIKKKTEAPSEITIAMPSVKLNGNGVNIATVNFLSETFEELIESNVDDGDCKDETEDKSTSAEIASPIEDKSIENRTESLSQTNRETEDSHKVVTEDFLQSEKKFCQLDSCIPLLSDIRFTGPATEIMSTSFSQDSPTEPTSPECEQDSKPNTAAEILKEWDSDSDSHSSNSSSGEFIWKQRGSNGAPPASGAGAGQGEGAADHGSVSGDSCSGSEGDEVEFVPSSWDCRAEPSKSSLRSLEQASLDSAGEKKRVVFKRQKYHCVYEYPRETLDAEPNSPAYLPDLSTYSEWDPTSVEEAELCYGHLFSMPNYPLRAGIAIGSDYDEDFFISSSARPFESLGIMSTRSQFFPGMHVKPMLEQLPDDEDFPPPPSPLPTTTLIPSRTPSLDFTTPDSGVEDITPGSMDEEFKKKIPESELTWRPVDSASSSESVSPSSPGGEALGGLRHTRDKLKLDLPPSPHVPSPRHNRVFNFVLEKPKRRDERTEITTPLVMTDETPVVTALPLPKEDEPIPVPEPTFSTFGKCVQKVEPEQKIILAEVEQTEVKPESPKVVEPVKGEGTVLDSGDEDSGIESSSKATLERKTNVS